MLFKFYEEDGKAVFARSIRELAVLIDSTPQECRKAFYHNVTIINGIEVIKYSKGVSK